MLSHELALAIAVMGVQGSGKTTIGQLLAQNYGVPFVDGDRLHPQRNIALMASGQPLSDHDRDPWLRRVGETFLEQTSAGGIVVACSSLKRSYRDIIREYCPNIFFVELHAPISLVLERISSRQHEFMPLSLLQSQYETLQSLARDEFGLRVAAESSPADILALVATAYELEIEDIS
jgi:carbohydrate kinase (thermoresistant glucokinase family)